MRKALIVGIDYYEHGNDLFGCVNDAHSVKSVLATNSDGTKNFDIRLLTATGESSMISRKELKQNIKELFHGKPDTALLYFAGHGYIESTGGYLVSSECSEGDAGLNMRELLEIANKSKANNKVIILDCCHSGAFGNVSGIDETAILSDGMTILTASDPDQYAKEENGSGVFTNLLVDALNGSGANLIGKISPGSVYAHIDQAIGGWGQRPIFKTNVKEFTTLREVQSSISLSDLKEIVKLFPKKGEDFQLNPTFEPERAEGEADKYPEPIEENTEKFEILQKYNRVNLLVPVDAPHMWHAAMQSKSCKLTVLGEHYWNLVKKDRI
ncbi:caspase family protein [uncultured Lacinutrix sp.]|uniref:caspase family protein n=1 Tax=uncultured Lacinutrix sp. TaxID=574032 RepID=UPI0026066AE1|nr:caspase family protein [uncultured Lacinutrix sp.]